MDAKSDALSEREQAIAARYAEGETYKEIAAALYIAPATVRNHLSAIYRKLGVNGKPELIKALNSSGDRDTEPLPGNDLPSVAVLPFTNMSGDPEQEFFCDGMVEDIITALSKISNLHVVARQSTLGYKDNPVDIRRIAEEQRVRYLLEGSVRKSGNRVRVSAQLIDAATGHHCWAEHYDAELDDVFSVQDQITRNVTIALQVTLTEGEQARVYANGATDVQAWECVVRGKQLFERHVREDNFEAQQLLDRAIRLDPDYATAWAYLGWTHWENARWGWGETLESSMDRAIECGHKALSLDETHADSWSLLGFCHLQRSELDQALAMTEKAVMLAPRSAFTLAISAVVQRNAGHHGESIRRLKRAMQLSPVYPAWYLAILGSAHHANGDNATALTLLREGNQREPESLIPKPYLVSVLVESKLLDEAQSVAAEILANDPEFTVARWLTHTFGPQRPPFTDSMAHNLREAGLPD